MASIQRIAIKDIALDDDRRIGGKGSLETLKTSIEKVGLINPITVRKSKEGNFPYTIIAGRRRVEAAILLDWTEIDALVYETDEAADDSYFTHVALAENPTLLLKPVKKAAQRWQPLILTGLLHWVVVLPWMLQKSCGYTTNIPVITLMI